LDTFVVVINLTVNDWIAVILNFDVLLIYLIVLIWTKNLQPKSLQHRWTAATMDWSFMCFRIACVTETNGLNIAHVTCKQLWLYFYMYILLTCVLKIDDVYSLVFWVIFFRAR